MWLATGLSAPEDIVVDGAHAYFTAPTAGTVGSVPIGGGAVTTLAQGQEKPLRIAIDSSYVYWTNNLGGAVMRARKDGSAMPAVFSTAVSPVAITVVPGGAAGCAGVPAGLYCAPASDNSGLLVVWSPGGSVVYDGFTIITPTPQGGESFISVDPRTWSVVAIPLRINIVPGWPYGSTFDSNDYYVAVGDRYSGAAGFEKATNTQVPWEGFADPISDTYAVLDEDGVGAGCATFFSAMTGGPSTRLLMLYRSGVHQLITFQNTSAHRVAIDATHVYWTDASGAIGALPLP
jgi:hypothetical protein